MKQSFKNKLNRLYNDATAAERAAIADGAVEIAVRLHTAVLALGAARNALKQEPEKSKDNFAKAQEDVT